MCRVRCIVLRFGATRLMSIKFPNIDPVAVQLGPLSLKWYGLAYAVGIYLGALYASALLRKTRADSALVLPSTEQIWDFMFWALFGIIVGGRLGIILFYHPVYYAHHPLEIFETWLGGMSFH